MVELGTMSRGQCRTQIFRTPLGVDTPCADRPHTHRAHRRGRTIREPKKQHRVTQEHNWENATRIHIYYKYTKNPIPDQNTYTQPHEPMPRSLLLLALPTRLVPSLKNIGLLPYSTSTPLESRARRVPRLIWSFRVLSSPLLGVWCLSPLLVPLPE